MSFIEHDIVELVVDIDERNLHKGDKGTIIHVYKATPVYEVEFPQEKNGSILVILNDLQIKRRNKQ